MYPAIHKFFRLAGSPSRSSEQSAIKSLVRRRASRHAVTIFTLGFAPGEDWRRGRDSNPRWAFTQSGFQDRRDRPLCHLSALQTGFPVTDSIIPTFASSFQRSLAPQRLACQAVAPGEGWHGRRDLNPQPTVLETATLPIELLPYPPNLSDKKGDGAIQISASRILSCFYFKTSETRPAPMVRPPSRMAKRCPFSMATGAISSISTPTLSPGITISTPCGKVTVPVTSDVRK